MKILVTGGAGFVGSHLVDALVERGLDVRVLDNLEPLVHGHGQKRPDHLNTHAEFLPGDIRDRDVVQRAVDGVEVIFHHAAAVGVAHSMYEIEHYVSVNSAGTAVLLEEILKRRDRIQKMVVASSMSIYGEGAYKRSSGEVIYPEPRSEEQLAMRRWEFTDEQGRGLIPIATPETKPLQPTSIYAVTKRDQEEMFLSVGAAYRIPTVALRYFNIYGTRQALSNPYTGVMAIFSSRLLNRHQPLVFEDGLQSRDFVHVSDIVQANLLVLEKQIPNGRVYNVGTGQPTTVLQIAELLAKQLDFPEPPNIVNKYRAGDIRHCYADITRIREEIGYAPSVSVEEGIQELLAWLRTAHAEDRVDQAARELEERGLTR
ncbi:MAG: NAD-dependent epimerase/dehydratase family protein [Candidatus Methylomirabilales bacterium]